MYFILTRYTLYRNIGDIIGYEMYLHVTISIILSFNEMSYTQNHRKRSQMNICMLNTGQHSINVRISVTAIGQLDIQGRRHQVIPLELSPERLLFLCPWNIPLSLNVKLCYELNDSYDHLRIQGKSLTKVHWKDSGLYTAMLHVSKNEKLRITGMLNRMICHYFLNSPINLYNKSGTGLHANPSRRLQNNMIQ